MSTGRRRDDDIGSYPHPQRSSLTDLANDGLHVRVKLRTLLDRAIDEGLRFGLRRGYKHAAGPKDHADWSEDDIERILHEIWLALDEVVDISDGEPPA